MKQLLTLTLCFSLFSICAQVVEKESSSKEEPAEESEIKEEEQPQFVIKVSPFRFYWDDYSVAYEIKPTKLLGLSFSGGVTYFDHPNGEFKVLSDSKLGWSGQLSLNYFFQGDKTWKNAKFAEFYYRYQRYVGEFTDPSFAQISAITEKNVLHEKHTLGFNVAYNWVIKDKLLIRPYIGGGWLLSFDRYPQEELENTLDANGVAQTHYTHNLMRLKSRGPHMKAGIEIGFIKLKK